MMCQRGAVLSTEYILLTAFLTLPIGTMFLLFGQELAVNQALATALAAQPVAMHTP